MKLIDKDAAVEEIRRRLRKYEKEYDELAKYEVWITAKEVEHRIQGLKEALSILDTIEVKDTDAFINKGCNFIRERLRFDDDAWYTNGELTLKDKVIEDFKHYMKEY